MNFSPSPLPVALGLFFLFFLSVYGTRLYIGFANSRRILDIPNARSSHETPTPRGGGLVFVILFLFACVLFYFLLPERRDTWLALLGGGGLVALVGWLDDRSGLAAGTRLLAHFAAVGWALYWLGGFPGLTFGSGHTWHLGLWGVPLALVGGVWLVNLYNFMDGIDGLAASEAVFASLAGAAIGFAKGDVTLALALFGLVAVVAGFLVWNWSPAKVFMGDIGSGLLGYVFVVFAVTGEKNGSIPALAWGILLSLFAVDATMTLFRRILRKEKLSEAHCSHVFQKAVKKGYSHKAVSLSFLFLNVLISCGVFQLLTQGDTVLWSFFLLTYAALGILWLVLDKSWNSVLSSDKVG